jgi:hypothetical protein
MHTEKTGGYERMEKKIPLRHETEKALNELYKPEKRTKPKPKDEIDEILEKSPGVSWLSPEDLEKEKVVIRKELGLEDNPKRPDDKKEKGGNA